jgi:hypothetical protein
MSELKVYHHELRPGEYDEFYLKYEADEVIAHQKYRRCLAMANYWSLVSVLVHGETQLKCMRRELKWHKLTDKFKETK